MEAEKQSSCSQLTSIDLLDGAVDDNAERYNDDDDDFDFDDDVNPEWICCNCLKRESIMNGLCGMCIELRPNLM
jgi:hypothetical protein